MPRQEREQPSRRSCNGGKVVDECTYFPARDREHEIPHEAIQSALLGRRRSWWRLWAGAGGTAQDASCACRRQAVNTVAAQDSTDARTRPALPKPERGRFNGAPGRVASQPTITVAVTAAGACSARGVPRQVRSVTGTASSANSQSTVSPRRSMTTKSPASSAIRP